MNLMELGKSAVTEVAESTGQYLSVTQNDSPFYFTVLWDASTNNYED